MNTDLFTHFPGAEFSLVFDKSSVDEGATLFGYITAADAQSGLETSVGRHSTVHCAPEEFSDAGKQKASFVARTFPVRRLVRMCVINAMSSSFEVSVKQSAVSPGLLRFIKGVKTKMIQDAHRQHHRGRAVPAHLQQPAARTLTLHVDRREADASQ